MVRGVAEQRIEFGTRQRVTILAKDVALLFLSAAFYL